MQWFWWKIKNDQNHYYELKKQIFKKNIWFQLNLKMQFDLVLHREYRKLVNIYMYINIHKYINNLYMKILYIYTYEDDIYSG